MITGGLVLLTDRSQLPPGRGLAGTVRECVEAGLRTVVVREHDLDPAERSALVAELAALAGLTVISSRIPDPAAAGVHLAARQASVPGPHGRSCHAPAEVREAAARGAAWATLSPYAASASKPGHGPALDPATLGEDYPVPVLALGGIHAGNARDALDAGADGVAVMGAVMRDPEPARVVGELLAVTG